ncbi:DUF3021 domain-containing protein [Clostridium sediminicola]|uniref:DUF3021 domain-containing protein n=1 Tax=Clostridium sediminicola TaxID=3114879 RepID=UPI0031F22795
MDYIKQFIKRGLFGITIGVTINQVFCVIFSLAGLITEVPSEIVISQFIIAALTGFYLAGVSVIFDVEEWSLLRQTITHFIAMLPYLPVAVYAGWMPRNTIGIISFIIVYILIYFIIWISFKKYWEKRTKELNEVLRKMK